MRKTIFDDGFHSYLVEGARFVGDAGIPMLMDLNNTQIPKGLIPFTKAKRSTNKRNYVHFYQHDKYFSSVLTYTKEYVDLLKQYDGVITPDPTLFVGNSKCLLETSTYFNRAVGFYLQKQGIPVIPNIRWTDENSYDFCFLGVPKHSIVSISTHGCCRSYAEKKRLRSGISKMLEVLEPSGIIVHGHMPDSVFKDYLSAASFYRFPSEFELTHQSMEAKTNGINL
ncbi:MAG: DUF4417 domain-containing protein [Erysipelotrichaceae bacterium]|nr:DUF4417 domain-containing protein [Erysipelotrichaceae bacterium]